MSHQDVTRVPQLSPLAGEDELAGGLVVKFRFDDVDVEAGRVEAAEPGFPGEQPADVAIVLDADALALADEVGEVDDVAGLVGGIGSDPLDVPQPALARLRNRDRRDWCEA